MYGKLRMSFISLVLFLCSTQCFGQFYSARTNILGLVTGNLNAEFGMTLNKKFSSSSCSVQSFHLQQE